MKIIQKFIMNHKFNNSTSQMIFYMVISIMILMHTIVSVNTTETGSKMAETETRTILTKTLFDLSKNPIISQQSSKTSTQIQATTSSSSSATILPSSSTLYSNNLSSATTDAAAFNTPHLHNALSTKDAQMGDCKSLTGAWGDVDPNIFYICDTNTKMAVKLRCPEGRGFFMGFGYSGCIPYEEWPACISSEHIEQVALCDSEHMQQPWKAMNPNKFYVCLQEAIEPTMLNCEQGKGFVHAVVVNSNGGGGGGNRGGGGNNNVISEVVGCANWEKWRSYMQCTDYY